MNQSNLEILLSLKDEASASFKQAASSITGTSQSMTGKLQMDLNSTANSFAKWGAAAIAAGAGLAIAFGVETLHAFMDAEQAIARVDSTLHSMVGTVVQVETGMTKSVTSFKVSGIEAENFKNKIESAKISIQEHNLALNDLVSKLSRGKISHQEYALAVQKNKNEIDALNISIKDYQIKLGESSTALVNITRSHKLTAEEIKKTREEILKASEAAIRLGFDDEAAAESITRFYQATGNLTQATKLNNLAMDLARAKNLDLATATQLVNLVLSGNGRALKQYQIDLKESASPLEALAELQQKVNGQSQAFAETLSGKIAFITESWNNVKEAIGGALAEALMPFINQFTTWLSDPKTKANFKIWTVEFQSWATVIIPVVIETLRLWAVVLSTIFDWLVKIGDVIDVAINKFNKLRGTIGGSVLKSTINALSPGIGAALNFVGLANGGIVTGPTPAIVGEGGGPEAVIPLDRLGSFGMGGGVTININGNIYGTDEDAVRQMSDVIASVVGQQLKIRTI